MDNVVVKTEITDKNKIDKGFYVSTIGLYSMTQQPYQDCEVGDKFMFTLFHVADSIADADKKVKIHFANDIFEEDIELFMVTSNKITHEMIDRYIK